MRIVLIFILFLGALTLKPLAAVKKPAKLTILNNFKYVLENYRRNNNGSYPTSWDEFNQKVDPNFLPIIENAEKSFDLKNRYVFLQLQPEFVIQGEKEKFIIMATDTSLEGIGGGQKPSRYLIAEDKNGELILRKYSEERLKKIFAEKGLRLAEYTQPTSVDFVKRSIAKWFIFIVLALFFIVFFFWVRAIKRERGRRNNL